MNDKRFSWLAGKEYNLRAKAVPHHHRMQQQLAQELSKLLEGVYHRDVIELWCGTWYTTRALLHTDPTIRVFAVDNEPIMLQQAKNTLANELGLKRVVLVEADILKYVHHQETGTLTSIVSAMTIHNFDKAYRSAVLQRIYADLDWDGIFINADKYALDDPQAHQATLDWQIEQFEHVAEEYHIPAFAQEWTEHYLRDNEPDLLMKQQEAIDEMEKIGFKDIQIIFREQMEAILVARK